MKAITCTGLVVLTFAAIILGAITHGLALSVLWGWFMTPLGIPAINIAQAIGIGMVLGLLVNTSSGSKSDNSKKSVNELLLDVAIAIALKPALYILLGYIVYQFV